MANKTIKQLSTEHTSALADDWLLMQKDANSVTGKIKMSNVFDGGWKPLSAAPNTVTALGNNSYSMVFNSVDYSGILSNGMRLRATRASAAPNTAFSLDGTNDYYVKTSPNKLTFTDDFVCSAWVYLTSYSSSDMTIVSRWNGTSGFRFSVDASTGTVTLWGYNGGSSNYSIVRSYQSIPLNKWVHVSAQLDMSAFTATTTTSYIMMDGVDVAASVIRAGTNPTALIQAGNLEVGSDNGGLRPFPGYIDQVAVYSAKVTQATILASINRALSGSETNLASAYSNGSVNDLNTTTPNNLTATNGATTVASSPFGNRGVSTTLEYAEVVSSTFSTNTTVTVRVPEGCQLPTTGGISSVDYSTQRVPYGWPGISKILGSALLMSNATATAGDTVVSGLKIPVTIPTNRSIKIIFNAYKISSSSAITNTDVAIWDGVVGSGTQIAEANVTSAGANYGAGATIILPLKPSSSSKTYYVGLSNIGGGTSTISASVTQPCIFTVELDD